MVYSMLIKSDTVDDIIVAAQVSSMKSFWNINLLTKYLPYFEYQYRALIKYICSLPENK